MPEGMSYGREQAGEHAPNRHTTIVDWLRSENRGIERIFDRFECGLRDELFDAVAQLKKALAIYIDLEERVLYPMAVHHCGKPADVYIDEGNGAHKAIRSYLAEMRDATAVTEERLVDLVRRMRSDVEHHIAEEENGLLPMIEDCCDQESLEAAVDQLNEEYHRLASRYEA